MDVDVDIEEGVRSNDGTLQWTYVEQDVTTSLDYQCGVSTQSNL